MSVHRLECYVVELVTQWNGLLPLELTNHAIVVQERYGRLEEGQWPVSRPLPPVDIELVDGGPDLSVDLFQWACADGQVESLLLDAGMFSKLRGQLLTEGVGVFEVSEEFTPGVDELPLPFTMLKAHFQEAISETV